MSDLIVAAIKVVFLAVLWLFIFFVADVIRRDVWGRRVPVGAVQAPAPTATTANSRPKDPTPTRFLVTAGDQQGLEVPATDVINLGRAPDSSFLLEDDYASARHAQLVRHDDQTWIVNDLGSTNGTYVNGQRVVEPTAITSGDVVRIGKTFMRLEA